VLTRAIARGENVMLLPGGEKEMMLAEIQRLTSEL
jgi:hypothetical protein